jgi:hypothetical protein
LLTPGPQPDHHRSGGSECLISLQVMTPIPEAQGRLVGFCENIFAIDSTGHRMTPMVMGRGMPFHGGEARLVLMRGPAEGASYLRTIEGDLRIAGRAGGPDERHAFRIRNVPLSGSGHVYGVAAAAYCDRLPEVPPDRAATTPEGFPVFTFGRSAALRRFFPPHVPEPSPLHLPDWLLLQPGLRDPFRVYVAPAPGRSAPPLDCQVVSEVGSVGDVTLKLALLGPVRRPVDLRVKLWNDEPEVVAVPAARLLGGGDKGLVLLWLRCSLDPPMPEGGEQVVDPSPIPVGRSGRGGTVNGQVLVRNDPLMSGHARIDVATAREDGTPAGPWVPVEVALDGEGRWRFVNMAPGVYRIRLVGAGPVRSFANPRIAWTAYVLARYGIADPVWTDVEQQIVVRPGGFSTARPWRAIARPQVIAGSR